MAGLGLMGRRKGDQTTPISGKTGEATRFKAASDASAPGVTNGGSRPRRAAFRRAVIEELRKAGEDMPELLLIARRTIDEAKAGDRYAREFLRDTLDGRPAQVQINAEDGSALSFNRVEFVVVDPHDPDEGANTIEVSPTAGPKPV